MTNKYLTTKDAPFLAEEGQEIAENMDIGREYTINGAAATPIDIEVWYPSEGKLIFYTYPGNRTVMSHKGYNTLVHNSTDKERYKRMKCYSSPTQLVSLQTFRYRDGKWHLTNSIKE